MIVRVREMSIAVEDVDDLTRLKVVSEVSEPGMVGDALEAHGMGRLRPGDDEVLLNVAELHRRARDVAAGDGWTQAWEAMITGATRAGWITDDGESVRAHVEFVRRP